MEITSQAPDGRVTFYPFTSDTTMQENGALPPDLFNAPKIDVNDDLLSATTSKPKGGVGTFVVTLGSHVNYKRIIQPGCWVTIHMSDEQLPTTVTSDEMGGLKMVGIVRSVRRIENVEGGPRGGTRTVRYVVSGEDFQSALNTPIYINSNLTSISSGGDATLAGFLLLGDRFRPLQSPSGLVGSIIDVLLGTPNFSASGGGIGGQIEQTNAGRAGQPFKVPPQLSTDILGSVAPGNYLTGMLTLFLQSNLIGQINLQPDIGNMVSAWSLAQTYCHDLLNEFYTDLLPVDTGDGTVRMLPSIVLRAIPFSSTVVDPSNILLTKAGTPQYAVRSGNRVIPPPSVDLPNGAGSNFYISRHISDGDILSFNSGRSDRERFNFFFCPPNYVNGEKVGEALLLTRLLKDGFASVSDLGSIQRYGLRPFVRYSNYMVSSGGDYTDKINNIVKDLWQDAHLYDSGVVSFAGTKQHIPVGTNISFIDRNQLAHVEQVDNTYIVGPRNNKSFRTSVAFVRLYAPDAQGVAQPTDPIGDDDDGQLGTWDRGVST